MSWGEYWCVRAEGATYDDPLLGTIVITDSDGGAAEGCQCLAFNTAVHNWILENEVDDEVVIEQSALEAELGVGALLVTDLLAARDEIYLEARNTCADLVPGTATADTCEDAELFDTDPLTPDLDPRPVYRGNLDGEIECIPPPVPSSSSCAFCNDPSGIQLSHGVYDIPEAIFEGFIARPHCLMAQGWGIGIGNDAFVLHGVARGDVLDRMGLASGDEFVSISAGGDTIALTTGEAAMQAYASMVAESSFSVTIKRGGNTLLRQYQIVP